MSLSRCALPLALVAALAVQAQAVEVGIPAVKLVVVDKVAANGQAKVEFVAKARAITKGDGTDPTVIQAGFQVYYNSASGAFVVPSGAGAGTPGWIVNNARRAKYKNLAAASGSPTGVKSLQIKDGQLIELAARTRGDVPLDLLAAGNP